LNPLDAIFSIEANGRIYSQIQTMKPKLILCLALVLSGHGHAAIIYPKAPDGGKQIVEKYLDPKLLKGLGITNVENLIIASPLAEYGGGILVTGKFLSTAQLLNWRYFLMDGTNAVGEMALNAGKSRYLKFSWMGKGEMDNNALKAIRAAEQLPQTNKHDYEVRYLDMIPYAPAIWLHSESDDIIIPLTDYWSHWKAFQPYSESEMIKLLKPVEDEQIKRGKKYPGIPD
jgi:hypothetical protein